MHQNRDERDALIYVLESSYSQSPCLCYMCILNAFLTVFLNSDLHAVIQKEINQSWSQNDIFVDRVNI